MVATDLELTLNKRTADISKSIAILYKWYTVHGTYKRYVYVRWYTYNNRCSMFSEQKLKSHTKHTHTYTQLAINRDPTTLCTQCLVFLRFFVIIITQQYRSLFALLLPESQS